jgi:hypothetical protein
MALDISVNYPTPLYERGAVHREPMATFQPADRRTLVNPNALRSSGETSRGGIPRFGLGAARGGGATILALGIVALLVGPVSAATILLGTPTTPLGLPGHVPPTPALQLAAARASAAHGAGPGAVRIPSGVHPASGTPSEALSLEMVWDAADGYVLAVAPNVTGPFPHQATYGPNDTTWKFAAGVWSIINATGGPANAMYPAMVFDAHDGYVLLFGGYRISGYIGQLTAFYQSNLTWKYSAGVWTNLTGIVNGLPPPGYPVQMAYDAADEYVVLFTGYQIPVTWTYAGGTWTNRTALSSHGFPPFEGAFAYDASDRYVLSFGGFNDQGTVLNATWEFHAGAWSNISANVTNAPPPRYSSGITFDPGLGGIVIFGGVCTRAANYSTENDTWNYSAGTWKNLSVWAPSNVTLWPSEMAYDPNASQIVLVNEVYNASTGNTTPVTWLLGNRSWSFAAPALGLTTIAADAGSSFTLEVRTLPHSGSLLYQYGGLPSGCASANAPTLTCTAESPGLFAIEVKVTDSAGLVLTLHTMVTVNPRPTIASFVASLPIAEVGQPLELTVNGLGGTGALSYVYSGLPVGCVSRNSANLACVPEASGSFPVSAQLRDALGVISGTTIDVTVVPAPTVPTFVVIPGVVDLGQSVVVAALGSGGIGPFFYTYSGLPAGCSAVNQLSFRCTPTASGSFRVDLGLADSLGGDATGSARLTVNTDPAIVTFSARTTQIIIGGSIDLALQVRGGTAPYVFVYSGLPGGCGSADAATLSCLAGTAGNFTVTAEVSDATGASATGSVALTIQASSPSTPPPVQTTPPGGHGGSAAASWLSAAPSMFVAGVAVGLLALLGAVLWDRRRARRAREGEAIVAELERQSTSPASTGSGGTASIRSNSPPDRDI